MKITFFFLFELQFILLISTKSRDPTHLEELLGAWQPCVPTQGKPASEFAISITSFLPPFSLFLFLFLHSPPLTLPVHSPLFHFLDFIFLYFFFFLHAPSPLSFLPISFSQSCLSSPSFSSLSLSDFLFPSAFFFFLHFPPSHRGRDTHRHYTQRKMQNLIVLSAEGHFLSETATPSLPSSET